MWCGGVVGSKTEDSFLVYQKKSSTKAVVSSPVTQQLKLIKGFDELIRIKCVGVDTYNIYNIQGSRSPAAGLEITDLCRFCLWSLSLFM